ncbi:MAG: cyclase family protein, partial [bacterium]
MKTLADLTKPAASVAVVIALSLSLTFSATAQADGNIAPFTASKVVDLTHAMHDDMAFWPGGVPFKKDRLVDYHTGGYQLHKFSMGENTGTHVDAPSHFVQGKRAIDQLALHELILPLVVLDAQASSSADHDYELTPADIERWEARHGTVPANSLFVMNTGWHKRFATPKRYINMDGDKVMRFPGFSAAAAKLLVARGVAGIGIDTLSLDHGRSKT